MTYSWPSLQAFRPWASRKVPSACAPKNRALSERHMASPIIVVDTLDCSALGALQRSLEETASLALLRQGRPIQVGICKVLRQSSSSKVELQVSSPKLLELQVSALQVSTLLCYHGLQVIMRYYGAGPEQESYHQLQGPPACSDQAL